MIMCPFYQKKFDEIGLLPGDIKTIDDITKLPFTVKQDLRIITPSACLLCPKDRLVRIHASSGTTGKQTVVGYTQNDIDVWAEGAARALTAAGATKTDSIHVSYGYGLFTAVWGSTTARRRWALPRSRSPPATPNARCKFCRISAPIFCAARPPMQCLSGRRSTVWGLIPQRFHCARVCLVRSHGRKTCSRQIEKSLAIKAYDI